MSKDFEVGDVVRVVANYAADAYDTLGHIAVVAAVHPNSKNQNINVRFFDPALQNISQFWWVAARFEKVTHDGA